MKKRSIFTTICALFSVLTIGMSSCALIGGGSSEVESSTQVESPTSSEKEEVSSTPDVSEDSENSSTPDVSEDPESSSTPDVSEDPESSSTPETSEDPDEQSSITITISAPAYGEEVFPYIENAKEYLLAGASANPADYYNQAKNPQVPIELKWQMSGRGARKVFVEYATKADYSDAIIEDVGITKRSWDLYNLYKDTTYYVRIKAVASNGDVLGRAETQFKTTDLGPRVMNVEGIYNVRDIGGHESSLGKTVQQGIAYRGGALTPAVGFNYDSNITEAGKKYMSEVMGIKGELDFRKTSESGIGYESVVPGVTLTYIPLGGYTAPFYHGKDAYRQLFSYLSNEENYPLYYHCTGGADRTGTVTFLLQAFLGISEEECIQDFAFTTFSVYGPRAAEGYQYWEEFNDMIAMLKKYDGANLQEKTENYLLSIGVTETEIYNIKAIFFGEETMEEPEESALTVTAPTGEVYPYIDNAKNYLLAGSSANPADYWNKVRNPQVPIQVTWDYTATAAAGFRVEYATKEDYSDAIVVEVDATKNSVDLYNLYKATTYYVRVSALDAQGDVIEKDYGEFYTTDLGPRVMNVEGIYNVRDIGGHESSLGKTVKQGVAYRGGSLTPANGFNYDSNVTEAGKKYMSEVMGIKGELDFRNTSESGIGYESVIPGTELTYISLGGYTSPFYHGKESYRKLFSYFADENNYPMYYHCTGGADRTGTVTFLLQAFLGVSEEECIQDFAITTFSVYGPRAAEGYQYWEEFNDMIALLKGYEGDNLQQKTESYLLSIGVTETEIYNIKAIFFGEATKTDVKIHQSYYKDLGGDLKLSVVGSKTPAKVYLNGAETPFTYTNNKITVANAQLSSLAFGTVECKVAFAGGEQYMMSFTCAQGLKAPVSYIKGEDGDLQISLLGTQTPEKLYLNGVETSFTYANNKITVDSAHLSALTTGVAEGKVVFKDGTQIAFTFNCKVIDTLMDDVMTFDENGQIVLTANKTLLYSDDVVGYGKTVTIKLSTIAPDKTDGGVRIFIGSYGFECRGGEVRPYTLDANGTMKEIARHTDMGLKNTIFNDGATVYMSISFVDGKAVMNLQVVVGNTNYEHTYTFEERVANEISSENAKMGFWIRTDAITSLTIYNAEAWANKQ